MKKILLFAGVMFLSTAVLTSCGSKDEKKDEDKKEEGKEEDKEGEEAPEENTAVGAWTQDVQDAYVNSCVQSAKAGMSEEIATEYCNCTLGKIMNKYPDPTQLQQIGQDEITSLAMECMTAEMMTGAGK